VLLEPEPGRSPPLRVAQARALRRLLPRFLFRALRVRGDEAGDVHDLVLARSDHPGSQRPTGLAAGADLVGREGRRQVVGAHLVRIGCGHVALPGKRPGGPIPGRVDEGAIGSESEDVEAVRPP
jgi:hypothetical protein